MTFPDSLMSIIPEEFTDLKNFASDFRRNYTDLLARTIGYAHLWHRMGLDQGSAYRKTRDALTGYTKAVDASSKLFRTLSKNKAPQIIDIATMKRLVYEAMVKHIAQARKA